MSERRVGYAPGVYDLFHVGHLNLLRNAKELCDHLVAGVVTGELARETKGADPAVPLEERLEIVSAIRYVDEAVVDHSLNKLKIWNEVKFDILFKGDDWKGTDRGNQLEIDMASVGVEVEYLAYTNHTSSTLLRQVIGEVLDGR